MTRTIRYLPAAARRVLILMNPKAGARTNRPLVDSVASQLNRDGLEVEGLSDLQLLARTVGDPLRTGVRAVIAAGGDGTVAAVVNTLPPPTPLAVLPLGTENLLAKYLSVRADPVRLAQTISHGATVALDAGKAGDRLFLLMAGVGFDGEVVRRVHQRRRGHIRHLSYAKPILDSIRSYQYPEIRVVCDAGEGAAAGMRSERAGDGGSFAARWLFVVNLPRYAAGLQFVPHAVGSDGLLDVCAFRHGSLLVGIRYLAGVVAGKHLDWNDCTICQTRSIKIESDRTVPYQLDGDPGGFLPVEIGVLPGRVRFVVAESWALDKGFRHV